MSSQKYPHRKPPQQAIEKQNVFVSRQQHYEGDVPTPEMMEHYQRIVPELPQKFIQWVDDERKHRRRLDSKIVNRFLVVELSRTIAAIIGLAGVLGVGVYFMQKGHPNQGMTIIISAAAAIVGIFITRRQPKTAPPPPNKS